MPPKSESNKVHKQFDFMGGLDKIWNKKAGSEFGVMENSGRAIG